MQSTSAAASAHSRLPPLNIDDDRVNIDDDRVNMDDDRVAPESRAPIIVPEQCSILQHYNTLKNLHTTTPGERPSNNMSTPSTPTSHQPIPKKKRKLQDQMDTHVVKTSSTLSDKLHMKIAKFFYANAIPFNAASSQAYIDMIESLRPGFKPPNRKQLSGELLNRCCDEVELSMKEEMASDSTTVTLQQDGWSSIQNDPIIGTCLHSGSKAYLLNAENVGSMEKSAENCGDMVIREMERIKEEFEKEVNVL